jgi:cystathionine beta-synthase
MAGIGTGGTLTGIGKFLKEKMPNVKIVGIDIEGSILTHYFYTREFKPEMARPYVLEGIGEDIIPLNYDWDVYDDMVMVGDKESFIMTRALLTKEGIYAGGSSGAAVVGAIKYAKELKEPKKILVIIPDSGNRYAGKIYNDDWMRDKGYFDNSFNVSVKEVIEVLGKTKKELITLPDTASVGDACDLMRNKDISQVPITRNDEIVGFVSENKLLRPLFESQISLRDPITVAMENKFEIVDENELLEKVANSLLNKKSVLITSNGKFVSILTDIDILNYMSHRAY